MTARVPRGTVPAGHKLYSAADRTVGLFSGRCVLEESESAANETLADTPKSNETIEVAAERWRANAMFTAEHLSKCFNQSVPETAKFRLTEKGDQLFLEKFSLGRTGEAYAWAGLMFASGDLYELTSVFVKAAKARQAGG